MRKQKISSGRRRRILPWAALGLALLLLAACLYLGDYYRADQVLNLEKYRANWVLLPAHTRELVIQGGCHAGFGMYGAQKGDGAPSLRADEQIRFTVDEIVNWLTEP